MTHRPIVILGGMGPQASAQLHQRILQKSLKHHDGNGGDFPYIVHFSLPIPDFISDESKKRSGIAMLQSLSPTIRQLNPSCIALACNTAHLLKDDISYLQGSVFVSLLETVANHSEIAQASRIGLLASPTTIRTKLYESLLAARNIAVLVPNASEQVIVESAIRNVIGMRNNDSDILQLHAVAASLVRQGAQAILLGCTELPLAFNKHAFHIPIFDCLDLYATAIVEQWSRQRFAPTDTLMV